MDYTPSGYLLGGSASYINAILNVRGITPTLITSWGPDFEFIPIIEQFGTKVILQSSGSSTIFENIYNQGKRKQYLRALANNIHWKQEYASIRDIDILFLCPIADEVDFRFIKKIKAATKIATIQGWLRKRTDGGQVIRKHLEPEKLKGVDIVILSDEDLPEYETWIPEVIQNVPTVVVTLGEKGAILYTSEEKTIFPPSKTNLIDATGAGDSFACGLALEYYATGDLYKAIVKGSVTASVVIENQGVYLPSLEEVQTKWRNYPFELIKKMIY
jgi:sugar/nucleoside kinase (ribokinase family)